MKFYLSYFKLIFKTGLQYRTAAIAGILTQIFFGFVYIMVYIAFFTSDNAQTPMTLQQIVSYTWLCQCFFSLVNMAYTDQEIFNLIRKGNIAYELIRPKNLYFMWYSKIISKRLSLVTLRCIPLLILAFCLPSPYRLSLPISISSFILFVLTLIAGTFLMTAITTLYHVIAIYTLDEKGISMIIIALADILSGLVVPIPFFPKFLQKISNILPFRYVSDLPFRVYTGNIPLRNGITSLIIQLIWIFITILIGYLLMKKAQKKVVVQGG